MGPPARLLLRPFLPTQAVFAQVNTVFLYRTTRDISGKNCHNLEKTVTIWGKCPMRGVVLA